MSESQESVKTEDQDFLTVFFPGAKGNLIIYTATSDSPSSGLSDFFNKINLHNYECSVDLRKFRRYGEINPHMILTPKTVRETSGQVF